MYLTYSISITHVITITLKVLSCEEYLYVSEMQSLALGDPPIMVTLGEIGRLVRELGSPCVTNSKSKF